MVTKGSHKTGGAVPVWWRRSGTVGESTTALVHDSELRTDPPFPERESPHSIAVRHPETRHPIEDRAGQLDLDSLSIEGSTSYTCTGCASDTSSVVAPGSWASRHLGATIRSHAPTPPKSPSVLHTKPSPRSDEAFATHTQPGASPTISSVLALVKSRLS